MIPNSHCESTTGSDVVHLELDITRKCPLACTYCYRSRVIPRGEGDDSDLSMPFEVAKDAIDWGLAGLSNGREKVGVWFMGGEPLAEFQLMKQVVEYGVRRAEELGKKITFGATTNMTLIDEEVMAFWRQHDMGWNTSVDGAPATHDAARVFPDGSGSSRVVEQKIPMVLGHKPNARARATISPTTAGSLLENALYLLSMGYKHLTMVPVIDETWTDKQLATLGDQLALVADLYIERHRRGQPFYFKLFDNPIRGLVKPARKRRPCGAGSGMVCVDAHGDIWPCHRFPMYDPGGHWHLGSIYGQMDGDKRSAFLEYDCVRDVKPTCAVDAAGRSDCDRCSAVLGCGTSCIAVNHYLHRDLTQPAPVFCAYNRLAHREALRIFYTLNEEQNPHFAKRYLSKAKSGSAKPKPKAPAASGPSARLPRLSCGAV